MNQVLEKERKRIKDHKGKTIDSDAFIEGVMQRSQTKELKAHLKSESLEEQVKIDKLTSELVVIREKTFLLG